MKVVGRVDWFVGGPRKCFVTEAFNGIGSGLFDMHYMVSLTALKVDCFWLFQQSHEILISQHESSSIVQDEKSE